MTYGLQFERCINAFVIGWSMDCLKGWGSFIHLAIPSMLMLCAEWWTYEIGSLLSGWVHICQIIPEYESMSVVFYIGALIKKSVLKCKFVIPDFFVPGLISEVELGAQSVLYGLANIAYMVYFHLFFEHFILVPYCINSVSKWSVFSFL